LEANNRALAGWKGYTTNLTGQSAQFVIDSYHQLWRIEKSFRMSKHVDTIDDGWYRRIENLGVRGQHSVSGLFTYTRRGRDIMGGEYGPIAGKEHQRDHLRHNLVGIVCRHLCWRDSSVPHHDIGCLVSQGGHAI